MKTLVSTIGFIVSSLLVVSTCQAQDDTLTILHFNDTHSTLAAIGPRNSALEGSLGGIARAATLIGMERMSNSNTLLLHAGDVFIGDVFFNKYFGVAELQMMAALGFDAMAVGNHEFDLTPAILDTALRNAFSGGGFPLLSANLILPDSTVQPLARYIKPYTIKQIGNIKVGIFGMTTPETNILSQPAPAVIDTNILQIASAMVDTLKAQQCQVIVCLSHLGIGLDSLVAYYVPGIHAIIGGHDHYLLTKPLVVRTITGQTVWVVQANAFYLHMGKLRMRVSSSTVQLLDYQAIPIDNSVPEEPTTAATVASLIAGIEATYGPLYTQKLTTAASFFEEVANSLSSRGTHDTPIGNLVTDAFRATTKTDIALEVGGSTAQPLYQGSITGADIFRMVGYGFNTDNGLGYRLATFKMKGADLVAGLEFGLSTLEKNDEYFSQVSGMRYTFDPAATPFARLRSVEVGGVPLDPLRIYSVTANEFVPIFLNYLQISYSDLHIFSDTTEFQVVAAYVSKFDTIRPRVEGRVQNLVTSVEELANQPRSFELHQNYPNPFNPSTTIMYSLPHPGRVTLVVYDMLGRAISTLVDAVQDAGQQRVSFNAAGLASGVYVYRLRNEAFVQTKKMLLMK